MNRSVAKNILVPIDFSEISIAAISTAQNLAKRFRSTVRLVHVQEFDHPAEFLATPLPMPDWPITAEPDVNRRIMNRLKKVATSFGIMPGNCHLLHGPRAFEPICELAQEISADLIVTSTHGYGGFTHALLGSTAERLVQHSPCPVFVSRQVTRKIDRILVPVDFSDHSFNALNYAISLAEVVGARIIVFHAVSLGYAYTSDGYAMYDLSALTTAAETAAERQMSRFVRAAKFGRVKFETVVRSGLPVDEICAFARETNVDVIVTATHGFTGLKHVLVGSVAEKLVRRADSPVLVVPSHSEIRIRQRAAIAATNGRPLQHRRSRHGMSRRYRQPLPHWPPRRRNTNKLRPSRMHK